MRLHARVCEVLETRHNGRVLHVQNRTYKGDFHLNDLELYLTRTFKNKHHKDFYCNSFAIEHNGYCIKGSPHGFAGTSVLRQGSYS